MAIIVLHKPTQSQYVLLGTGYGAYKASRPSFFGGNLFPHEDEGSVAVVAVCDEEGTIIWFSPEELQVVEVDGRSMASLLRDR